MCCAKLEREKQQQQSKSISESSENDEYNGIISYWQCFSELKIFAIKKAFFSETPTVGV
jgi:hypothetical protein